jgi:hypothetical protein
MTKANAIVFDAPQQLSVQMLDLKPFEAADIEVEVSFSGISTGTERLLWDGTMPPFPGLAYPLVPGYETVGTVVKVGDSDSVKVGDQVFIPGSYSFQGVRNIFGGAGSRLIVSHDRVVRVAPDLGPVRRDRDAMGGQRSAVADAREHQQLRALDRTGGQDDLAPRAMDLLAAGAAHGHADRAAILDQHAQPDAVGEDLQIGAPPRGMQIGDRRAPAPSAMDVELVDRDAFIIGAVHVAVAREAQRGAGVDEGAASRRGLLHLADMDRPVGAAELAGLAGEGLELAEIGQAVAIGPAARAGGSACPRPSGRRW